ncbi:MAG: hypothetical protein LUD18_09085 [Lachnospiraceae bacterium]|nr:hypothetical protein [Lachnospiraceae bacterium]
MEENIAGKSGQSEAASGTVKPKSAQLPEEQRIIFGCDLEGREVSVQAAEERKQEFLPYAAYLSSDASYSHHVEQLYLMCREGFSKEFIEAIFCRGVDMSLVSVDVMRCLALVAGEDFAMEYYRKKFTLKEATEALYDQAAREKFQMFDSIDKLTGEVRTTRERYDTQMAFLKTAYENSKAYADERIQRERETFEQLREADRKLYEEKLQSQKTTFHTEKELLQSNADKEKDRLENAAGQYSEKYESAQKEMEKLRGQLEAEQKKSSEWLEEKESLIRENKKITAQLEKMTEIAEKAGKSQSQSDSITAADGMNLVKVQSQDFRRKRFLSLSQKDKRSKKRNDFIIALITNTAYSDEQFEIIYQAVKAGLPLKELEQICNPKLPPRNMQMLANYFLRPEDGIFLGKGAGGYGSTSDTTSAGRSGEGA